MVCPFLSRNKEREEAQGGKGREERREGKLHLGYKINLLFIKEKQNVREEKTY